MFLFYSLNFFIDLKLCIHQRLTAFFVENWLKLWRRCIFCGWNVRNSEDVVCFVHEMYDRCAPLDNFFINETQKLHLAAFNVFYRVLLFSAAPPSKSVAFCSTPLRARARSVRVSWRNLFLAQIFFLIAVCRQKVLQQVCRLFLIKTLHWFCFGYRYITHIVLLSHQLL